MFVFRNHSPDHSNAAPMSRDRDLLYFWGARFVRQTFFAAIIIPFIVVADARADVSFSTVERLVESILMAMSLPELVRP